MGQHNDCAVFECLLIAKVDHFKKNIKRICLMLNNGGKNIPKDTTKNLHGFWNILFPSMLKGIYGIYGNIIPFIKKMLYSERFILPRVCIISWVFSWDLASGIRQIYPVSTFIGVHYGFYCRGIEQIFYFDVKNQSFSFKLQQKILLKKEGENVLISLGIKRVFFSYFKCCR